MFDQSIFPASKKLNAIELTAFSAAGLYFELFLIRFTSAEVLYLGYFSNFILITSFIGLGLGFLSAQKNLNLDNYLPFTLLFIFSLVLVTHFDANVMRNHFGLFFFGNISGNSGVPASVLLLILFVTTVMILMCIGRRLALAFTNFSPLKAYTLDITGSLIGIVIFSLQSFANTGPVTWIFTGSLMLVVGYLSDKNVTGKIYAGFIVLTALCISILLLSAQPNHLTIWSAYQKLEFIKAKDFEPAEIRANGIVHQRIIISDISREHYYGFPYKIMQGIGLPYDDVLIVGAGSGTDVATAISFDAKQIDAVEIDSQIIKLGKMFNPDHPYSDNRVNIYIEDGRQFIKNTDKKYDLIIFALPDSLMRLSGINSIRLESFLFTREAFEDVKAHLKPHGVFVMYNQYRWDWLVNKIATTVVDVFERPPAIVTEDELTMLLVGNDIGGSTYSKEGFTGIATDDWPFVYMQKPAVHWLYIGMIVVFLVASILGVWLLAPKGTLKKPEYNFFFMGMAFLLLETKSLTFFTLLFGTTWIVNSVAFFGILLSVLLANLAVQRFNIRKKKPLFICLFVSLALAYVVPPSYFLSLNSIALRFIIGIIFMFLPIFFANLIFSREFRDSEVSTRAFGWNLLGAVAGGGLEYLSLLIGFKNLLWIIAACYMLAGLLGDNEDSKKSVTATG